MIKNQNRVEVSTTRAARQLAEARISQSRISAKLGGAQRESLVVQLSAEATRQTAGDARNRPQQILQGLSSFMMSVSLDEKPTQKRVTKRRVEWVPTARVGQVKEGLSVMGRLKIIDEVDEQSGGSSNFLALSLSSSGSSTSLSVSMGTAGVSNSSGGSRIQGGEALQNLMKNGLVADGLKALLDGDKRGSAQPGAKSLTVRTNGTGRQKVLSLTRGGLLNQSITALGAFQILDSKPILKKPMDMSNIFHDFSSGAETPNH
jgi:hypothetical protein